MGKLVLLSLLVVVLWMPQDAPPSVEAAVVSAPGKQQSARNFTNKNNHSYFCLFINLVNQQLYCIGYIILHPKKSVSALILKMMPVSEIVNKDSLLSEMSQCATHACLQLVRTQLRVKPIRVKSFLPKHVKNVSTHKTASC